MSRFALPLLALLALPPVTRADGIDREKLDRIDAAAEAAIKKGGCPGAVVLVVHRDEVVFRRAYGNRAVEPGRVPMAPDTVFDMASLTKPMATATSVMILAERGKLSVSDRVAKYLPQFAQNGKQDVTIEQLLLHRSGLIPDNELSDYDHGPGEAMQKIDALKPQAEPGTHFA